MAPRLTGQHSEWMLFTWRAVVLEQLFSLRTEKLTESEITSALTRYKCEVEKVN